MRSHLQGKKADMQQQHQTAMQPVSCQSAVTSALSSLLLAGDQSLQC